MCVGGNALRTHLKPVFLAVCLFLLFAGLKRELVHPLESLGIELQLRGEVNHQGQGEERKERKEQQRRLVSESPKDKKRYSNCPAAYLI